MLLLHHSVALLLNSLDLLSSFAVFRQLVDLCLFCIDLSLELSQDRVLFFHDLGVILELFGLAG